MKATNKMLLIIFILTGVMFLSVLFFIPSVLILSIGTYFFFTYVLSNMLKNGGDND